MVCLFTVPLVWPKLPLSEGVMTVVDGLPVLKGVMTKTGIGAGIVDKCVTPLRPAGSVKLFSELVMAGLLVLKGIMIQTGFGAGTVDM